MAYFARPAADGSRPQLLRRHLRRVGAAAARFAEAAGLDRQSGWWAGVLHDLGKYSDEFQRHRLCLNPDGTPNGAERWTGIEHSCHGAWVAGALDETSVNAALAFAISAHHTALPCLDVIEGLDTRTELILGRPFRVNERAMELLERALDDRAFVGSPPPHPTPGAAGPAARREFELRTRMIYSCLVDADRLDAERWVIGTKQADARRVSPLDPLTRLADVLGHIETLAAGRRGSETLRDLRRQVLEHALGEANLPPGFFSLTVPTGGGKTLTSLAWALKHAAANGHRRVIFVIPYLSIVEQNVEVIRSALGGVPDLVLEHHSDVTDDGPDGDDCQDVASVKRRLLAENWDAPVIVTTTVRFFETLFSNRPRDARRLHNIANAVVVFDEAQTFPPDVLRPMSTMLDQLSGDPYRTSFLFCTATQPAFGVEVGQNQGSARQLIEAPIREIAPDPLALFTALKRVDYSWPERRDRLTPEDLASAMDSAGRAMAVMNTKEQARIAFRALKAVDPEATHLSTRLCAAHRLQTIALIRDRLRHPSGRCLVAATQLVEAGVDLDFDAVWRAMGPYDSIAQAAGRCNREGRLGAGVVTVFHPWDDKVPPGVYAHATVLTAQRAAGWDPHHPRSFTDYFESLYQQHDLDVRQIDALRQQLDFPEVANRFAIIDDDTTSVLVPWGEGISLIKQLRGLARRGDVPSSRLIRAARRFSVGLYTKSEFPRAGALVEEIAGVQVFVGHYDGDLGLMLPGDFSEG